MMGADGIRAQSDSQLVVNQVLRVYIVKEERMWKYLVQVKTLRKACDTFELTLVPREQNEKVDRLAQLASNQELDIINGMRRGVIVCPSSLNKEGQYPVCLVSSVEWWKAPIFVYLSNGTLLQIGRKPSESACSPPCMYYGRIYCTRRFLRSFSCDVFVMWKRLMCCKKYMKACGNHSGHRALSHKALRVGYLWPILMRDAKEGVQTCNDCQRHADIPRKPT